MLSLAAASTVHFLLSSEHNCCQYSHEIYQEKWAAVEISFPITPLSPPLHFFLCLATCPRPYAVTSIGPCTFCICAVDCSGTYSVAINNLIEWHCLNPKLAQNTIMNISINTHVQETCKQKGLGRQLETLAKLWAATKLFLFSHYALLWGTLVYCSLCLTVHVLLDCMEMHVCDISSILILNIWNIYMLLLGGNFGHTVWLSFSHSRTKAEPCTSSCYVHAGSP